MKLTLPLRGRKTRARVSALVTRIKALDGMVEAGSTMLASAVHASPAMLDASLAASARDELAIMRGVRHRLALDLAAVLDADHARAQGADLGTAEPTRVVRVLSSYLPFYAPPPGYDTAPWLAAVPLFALLGLDDSEVLEIGPPHGFLALAPHGLVHIVSPDVAPLALRTALDGGTMSAEAAFALGLVLGAVEA